MADKTKLDTSQNLVWVKVTYAKASDIVTVILIATNIGLRIPTLAIIKVYPVPMKPNLRSELLKPNFSNGFYTIFDIQVRIVINGILKPQNAVDSASLVFGINLLGFDVDGVWYGENGEVK